MSRGIDDISYDIIVQNEKITLPTRRSADMQVKINELLVALHEAINSPKGIVPQSADDFYSHRYYTDLDKSTGQDWGGEYYK